MAAARFTNASSRPFFLCPHESVRKIKAPTTTGFETTSGEMFRFLLALIAVASVSAFVSPGRVSSVAARSDVVMGAKKVRRRCARVLRQHAAQPSRLACILAFALAPSLRRYERPLMHLASHSRARVSTRRSSRMALTRSARPRSRRRRPRQRSWRRTWTRRACPRSTSSASCPSRTGRRPAPTTARSCSPSRGARASSTSRYSAAERHILFSRLGVG